MQYQIGNFAEDTAVTPDPARAGRYTANLSPNWNVLYVFGGVSMATAVNAARSAVTQPGFELQMATATFLAPIQAGPQTLDVRPLRASKGAEQLTVEMRSGAASQELAGPDLHVVCTFAPKRRTDTTFVDLAFPDVPGPHEVERKKPPAGYGVARLPYNYSVESRLVRGNLPWDSDWQAGPARWAAWHRLRNTMRRPDGTLDPLVYVPAADMVGPAVLQAKGPGPRLTMVISLEISLHVFAPTESEWLLQDARATQAADGYASGIVNLWDERGTLVAQALQRAILRPLGH